MAKAIMIQGTTSNAGKSLLTAGLCRIFKEDGYKVAPFKSQNMALNSFITDDGLEMGRAQAVQAEACGIRPDVRMNPILLKPTSDKGSQVILHGEVKGTMLAKDYFATKHELIPEIKKAYESLAEEFDIIVIEGAGSPCEINLKENDIVNMGMAKIAKAPVLIAGDIERGGLFAALAGTMLLLNEDEKLMVKGTLINKFRGDVSLLEPGLRMLENIINVPTIGVIPHLDVEIDDEDSLSGSLTDEKRDKIIDIGVIGLPRISNFTDFNPFSYIEGVGVRYIKSVGEFGNPDMIIIPGTKNTMADLLWIREKGLEAKILKYANSGNPIFGICGGYQMLGKTLSDPDNVEHGGEMSGLGLIDYSTIFEAKKIRTQIEGNLSNVDGIFKRLSNEKYSAYEIHMGITDTNENIVNKGNIYGTYFHGIFDKENISKIIIEELLKKKGLDISDLKTFNNDEFKESQYVILARELRKSLDMKAIYEILEKGI